MAVHLFAMPLAASSHIGAGASERRILRHAATARAAMSASAVDQSLVLSKFLCNYLTTLFGFRLFSSVNFMSPPASHIG
jgi:hypothetical protein